MTWNYRIIQHNDHLALHEVYYASDGAPNGYTTDPISFVAHVDQGPVEIISSLEMALRDARNRPMLPVSAFAPKAPE